MSNILIRNTPSAGVTIISNQFITDYMPKANGEFVKVYLYLLYLTQREDSFSLSSIADAFDCTERDIQRAFQYWEKANLLKLFYENRKLTAIEFPELQNTKEVIKESADSPKPLPLKASAQTTAAATADETFVSKPKEPAAPEKKKSLTSGQKKALQEKEEVHQFLYIAEQYLGRPLTKTDTDNLLYYYAELHFSADLIEYLVEYCVSKGSRSARYIDTVALAWATEGISTVKEAKKSTTLYNKKYFIILKAMGIKGRNPVEAELKFIDHWLRSYDFSMDIITEACSRTVMQTGQASFQYTDSILQEWNKRNVHHLSDIEALDLEHRNKAAKAQPKDAPAQKGNKFTAYPHREYDYDEIKKSLFNQ